MSFYETYPSPAWLPYTICTPSIHTRGISRTNVTRPTQIWSCQPFNELLRGISSLTWLRQPFTEFLRGISRTNVIHEIYPGPTWLGQPFNELLRDISRPNTTTFNDFYVQWASTRHTWPTPQPAPTLHLVGSPLRNTLLHFTSSFHQ